MSVSRRLSRTLLAASVLALGACAPSFGPGVQIGLGPGGSLELGSTSCSPLSAEPMQAGGVRATASRIFGIQSLVNQLQARYSLGLVTPHMRLEASKQRVAGGC